MCIRCCVQGLTQEKLIVMVTLVTASLMTSPFLALTIRWYEERGWTIHPNMLIFSKVFKPAPNQWLSQTKPALVPDIG